MSTREDLEPLLARHRFRPAHDRPDNMIWYRGRRSGRRFVATLAGDRLDIAAPRVRRRVEDSTLLSELDPDELDLWIYRVVQS